MQRSLQWSYRIASSSSKSMEENFPGREGESLRLRAYWESYLTQDSEESSEPMERRQGLSSSALWEQMHREGYMWTYLI